MSVEQCALFQQLAANVEYQAIIAVKCALCVLGAYAICYQWHKEGVRFLVHDNTKVVFKFYYGMNIAFAILFALYYIFELIRLRFDCVIVNFRTVLLTKGLAVSAVIAAHYVILVISFERLYSSLFPAHFEKNSCKGLVFALVVTIILIFGLFTMYCLSNGFTLFGDIPVVIMEDRIEENAATFSVLAMTGVFSNAFSLFMFSSDLYLNFIRKRSAVNPSLSISYQRSENRRVILIILPIEIIESILGLVTTTALVLQGQFIDITMPMQRVLFVELFTYPMFLPLTLAAIIEYRIVRRVRSQVTTSENAADHFANLRLAWQL